MANTTQARHNETDAEARERLNGEAGSDQAAWLVECAAIKCRTDAGEVWAYSGGKLFTIPAPAGFGDMPPTSRRLFAMMAMQFLPTRVGQNASGDISAEIAKAVNDPASYFTTQKDKDAFEASYADGITKLVDNAKGWTPEAIAKMNKEDKAARSELVAKSIERTTNREKHFASMVTAAIEAGRNVPAGEKKRIAKATGGDAGLEL